MPKSSRLTLAKEQILSVFSKVPQKVYSSAQLAGVLLERRSSWLLANRTNVEDLIAFLINEGALRIWEFKSGSYDQKITRYSWGNASPYELALSLKPRAYLCHATAVLLHGLTQRTPKTIYLNSEQSPKPLPVGPLRQEGIDRSFSREQRQSNLIYVCDSVSVTSIAGKNTQRLGVEEIKGPTSETLAVTNLERTLVDVVVRPTYAGGVSQLLETYRAAKDRVSVDQLLAILKNLGYIYPYHQAIGFLMQKAGYPEQSYAKLREFGLRNDFYLAHAMTQPHYSEEWRLHYPKVFAG